MAMPKQELLEDFGPEVVAAVKEAERCGGAISMAKLGKASEDEVLTSGEIDTLLGLVRALGVRVIETDPDLSPGAGGRRRGLTAAITLRASFPSVATPLM